MGMEESRKSLLNKYFFEIFILFVLIATVFTYVRLVILKDYQIFAQTSCDPTSGKCFKYVCDPVSDSTCSSNPDERVSYYKKISKSAASIAACEMTSLKIDCATELTCLPGEEKCSYEYCNSAIALKD